ncbi:serine hydrolase [Leucobacter sp. wl10]|uniref:serine hydrolase domain-containing protein n=1 Tax=Leucobacter sp. wl10 TaxID=2304677 RepID=UPI000E5AF18C|nr:serine hydrolase [Leucobacter sp. wl10]RGE20307.1 class C beta-lactamase-related serine hydrolase [Leucobacter sp. wl10]
MTAETGYGLNGPTTGFIQVVPPLDQWQFAPYLQWSMQNIQSFLPVRRISRGVRATEFAQRPADLTALTIPHPWEERSASFIEVMQSTFTDGWMVVHQGAIVAEQYTGTLLPAGMHLLMSVSKSLTATTAGLLAASGELDLESPVTSYVPELAGSGYEGALVRHLVDMRTGVRFSEEYLNEDAEVRLLEEAIGWAPKKHVGVPDSLLGFLATLGQDGPHGGAFDYKSCETDALGFVIQGAAGGRHAADVMSERLWQPMGAEFDAHVGVDGVGGGMFDGGVSAAMRDLARFGSLFANRGSALDGARVLPEWWVDDTFAGGPDSREAFALSPEPTLMPGGMYRNGFWFPGESADVMLALGIHGQMIYVNRATGVVGVKVSSWPTPQDAEKLFWTVRAFEAASWALSRGEI